MSAIFGIWNINGDPVEEKYLQKMQAKVCQYGRDGQDIFVQKNIGLGCCLSKFGVSSQADVPIHADGEIMLACDALIYNWDELLDKIGLAGTENISTQGLLLAAYRKWGEYCPKYINGDFAFAVWEKAKNQLFIARDHLGVRSLYYFYNGFTFAFATDYRALLALPFVGKQLDEVKLYALLSNTYHIDPEATFFAQIKRLPQAHTLYIGKSELQKSKYWSPGVGGKIIYQTEEEYAKALYAIVDDAIRLRIRGVSGIVGAELSGGLDSSVITILANRELNQSGKKLEGLFSWSPPFELLEEQSDDERKRIAAVCLREGLGCDYLDPRETKAEMIQASPEGAGMAKILSRGMELMTARGIKFILSGWGGDDGISHRGGLYELMLEGYFDYFFKQAFLLAKGSVPRFVKIIIANTMMQWFRPYSYFGNPNQGIPDIINRRFKKKMKSLCKRDILYFAVDAVKGLESGVIQARTELSAWLGAEHDAQYLYPFLDYRVIDFAVAIPRHLYYKQGVNRYIFRQAFAKTLPPEFSYYFTKDDVAKSAMFRCREAEEREETATAAGMISRGLFSEYIDWDKLQKAVNSSAAPEDLRSRLILKKKLLTCLAIGRILAETGGEQ